MAICYQNNMFFSPAEVCPPQTFEELTKSAQTKWLIEQHRLFKFGRGSEKDEEFQKFCLKEEAKKRGAGEKFKALPLEKKMERYAAHLKESLPVFIFGAKEFDARETDTGKLWRRRNLEGVHVNGLFMFDVDHVENPREIYERTLVEGFPWRVFLAHITPSGKGLRLVCAARLEIGNIADNQIELARALGVRADASCIDASRISFCPMAEEIMKIDNELFTYENQEFYERFNADYRMGHTDPTDDTHSFDDDHDDDHSGTGDMGNGCTLREGDGNAAEGTEGVIEWHGYDIQKIIDARYPAGNQPCAEKSNRHAESLKLASDLIILFDGDKKKTLKVLERQPWVQEIIQERNENVRQTVDSATERMQKREKEQSYAPLPSKAMQEAIETSIGKKYKEIVTASSNTSVTNEATQGKPDLPLDEWGRQIEALFPKFPLLKDVCAGLKLNQYPAAVYTAGGLLMTLMTRCWYRFYHRPQEKRRLNCSLLVIGDPASGKSFATEFYKLLTAPIVSSDKAGVQAINRYKEESRSKASNKEKPQKPKALVRIHPSRTSNAQFIQDMVNAVEVVDGEEMQLHMLTFDTELDNSIQNQKGGSWIDKASMELKAFHNEEDGQAYSNLDSPMQNFNVTWNYIYTGTPIALEKKVTPRNFGSGLATRLTVIPLPQTDYEMMNLESFETTDFKRIERMKEWAFKLDAAKGELKIWPVVLRLYDWTARRMADAKENQSKADEMLLKRCAYHGINYSAPYILMRHWSAMHQEGHYWCGDIQTDETDCQFAELLTNIHFACQKHFFGAMADAYFDNMKTGANANIRRRHQASVDGYQRLPEMFTIEDVKAIFRYNAMSSVYSKLKRLENDRLAEKIIEGANRGKYKKINAAFI